MRIYDGEKESWRRSDVVYRRRVKKSRFWKTLAKYTKLYCRYTKLVGFRYFVEERTSWFDRMLWGLLYAIAVPTMIYTICRGYIDIMENPCFNTVESDQLDTEDLDFPGVSICSINRISRRAAMEMANELFQLNVTRLSADEIFKLITQLGDLYDSEITKQNREYRIDHLLAESRDHIKSSYKDITKIMMRLTPPCSVLLTKCRFHDQDRNCSEMFTSRKTQDGFCCTFNYATIRDDISLLEPLKVDHMGKDGGLSVLLESFVEDYLYPIFPITGFKVTIFNPHDYPDMTSGGVIEIFVSPTTERNVEIQAIVSYSTTNVIPYSLEERHCVFPEEMVAIRASYTYSDCIVDCKVADMLSLCNCVPFFLPNRDSNKVCNLEDVPCLLRYKYRWSSVVPNSGLHIEVDDESENILHCNNCYPLCGDVTYTAKMMSAYIPPGYHTTKLLSNVYFKNQSVLNVYFNSFGTTKLKQDVVYRWYELLGDASGIGGIFVGFSLIAVVEFVYFVGLFVFELLKGPDSSDGVEDESGRERPTIQKIYWGELYPRSRQNVTAKRHYRIRDKY
ncbi:sodium channel protein Nach-like [Lasioglossum baleicum]|uniref:sodium channel protein Nach-like n=1 Tax=Lasioglossum baleicum TaxID=434251 RepID=UPI003FCD0190